MKTATAVLILMLLIAPRWAETKTTLPSTPANYVQALQTVNSFLWAWVNRDAESGRRLLSRRLASKFAGEQNESWFSNFMVGLSSPHHQSFEVGHGKSSDSRRWFFPVVLYEYCTGEPEAFEYKSGIEVIQEGDAWRVDVLPATSEE